MVVSKINMRNYNYKKDKQIIILSVNSGYTMNVYDETLIRFDATGNNICITFTKRWDPVDKTISFMNKTCQSFLQSQCIYPPFISLHAITVKGRTSNIFNL